MAHPDFHTLLDALAPFAETMLRKHGGFHPFGASITQSGEVVMVGASDGTEHPHSVDLITLMEDGFRSEASSKKIRAAGICFDSRFQSPEMKKKSDAICVSLYREKESYDIYLPYKKNFFKSTKFGESVRTLTANRIFST